MFSLVYGMEAVLPIEVKTLSLCVLMDKELEEAKGVQARYEQLNFIEKKRLTILCHSQVYQIRMMITHNKKVCLMQFWEEELVLKKISQTNKTP